MSFYPNPAVLYERQVGATEPEGAKNLVKVETRQRRAAGATTPTEIKGKIVEFLWHMKKNGAPKSTIRTRISLIENLVSKGANLFDPESVKTVIASQDNWPDGYKRQFVWAYDALAKMLGLTWRPPRYKQPRKLPFIPTEQEINALIASCGPKTSTLLQLLKETAMRIGEAWRLEWTDVDTETNTITLNDPEKNGVPRRFKVTSELIARIHRLPKRSEKIFGYTRINAASSVFRRSRRRIASKLENPRLDRITFHTFRHWKASMEYDRTKDLLHVKQLLGHKSINSTLVYTHLIDTHDPGEWISRVTQTVNGARTLVENGFELVTTFPDGLMLFRKPK